jgi:hypothetical protein
MVRVGLDGREEITIRRQAELLLFMYSHWRHPSLALAFLQHCFVDILTWAPALCYLTYLRFFDLLYLGITFIHILLQAASKLSL